MEQTQGKFRGKRPEGRLTQQVSVRGIASTGNVKDPAGGSFNCFYVAASNLDRKRSEVAVYSVARSVAVAALRIGTQFG